MIFNKGQTSSYAFLAPCNFFDILKPIWPRNKRRKPYNAYISYCHKFSYKVYNAYSVNKFVEKSALNFIITLSTHI